MARYNITSTEQAVQRGLSVPQDKSLHVVDSTGPSVAFSTSNADRAGRWQAAMERAETERDRAAKLHEEAKKIEQEASESETKATLVERQEGVSWGRRQVVSTLSIATGASAVGITANQIVGPAGDGNLAYGIVMALLGLGVAAGLASRYPRGGVALGATLVAIGGKHILTYATTPRAPQR